LLDDKSLFWSFPSPHEVWAWSFSTPVHGKQHNFYHDFEDFLYHTFGIDMHCIIEAESSIMLEHIIFT